MKMKRLLSLLLALAFVFAACVPAFAAEEKTYKNVIIMIGDGMGENHLKLAEEYGHELFMNTHYDQRGQSRTMSLSSPVTDSAAGGTALACGMRVINWTVGVSALDPTGLFLAPVSIAEVAQEKGMRTGIVTTDTNAGATPADFSVHVLYRKMSEEISKQQLGSDFDLIWSASSGEVSRGDAAAHGFTLVTNWTEMMALRPGSRSFGQFSGKLWHTETAAGVPTLAEMTSKAITLLNKNNDEGFFLMVEGAHIDKNSHAKSGNLRDYDAKRESVVDAVVSFDNAIEVAANFAEASGDTIVVVTADHETGKLYFDDGRYRFHTAEHTNYNVPLFVYGCKDLIKDGKAMDNYKIPRLITAKLGWSGSEFPRMQPGTLLKRLQKITGAAA